LITRVGVTSVGARPETIRRGAERQPRGVIERDSNFASRTTRRADETRTTTTARHASTAKVHQHSISITFMIPVHNTRTREKLLVQIELVDL